MTKEECRAVYNDRLEYSKKYEIITTKPCPIHYDGKPESDYSCNCESYFSHNGCDCCNMGAGDVYDCTASMFHNTDKGKERFWFDVELCNGCLCSFVNGDDSDLDYSYEGNDDWREEQCNYSKK